MTAIVAPSGDADGLIDVAGAIERTDQSLQRLRETYKHITWNANVSQGSAGFCGTLDWNETRVQVETCSMMIAEWQKLKQSRAALFSAIWHSMT